MKYKVIGSESQVAAVDYGCSLSAARRMAKPARFSNGHPALVIAEVRTKSSAQNWLDRCNSALAFKSGRLGRWLTPTFVIVAI